MHTFDNARWFKSSRSSGGGDNCVEVAIVGEAVGVRDTKQKGTGPILSFTRADWDAFIEGTKGGEFDL